MNLSGVSKDDIQRGDVVTTPGWLHPTTLADVQLRYLSARGKRLRHNTQLKFFSGASESVARVRLLSADSLAPGEVGWAQLSLQEPLALVRGDRFIVRVPSPPATVGGGTVVDPNPGRKHRRLRHDVIERLETLAQGSPADILLQDLERHGPMRVSELLSTGSGDFNLDVLVELVQEERVVTLDKELGAKTRVESIRDILRPQTLIASHTWWLGSSERMRALLSAYHRQAPLQPGMSREALRSGLHLQPTVFNGLTERACAESLVLDEGAIVRLPAHQVCLNDKQKQKADLLFRRFKSHPYSPPSVKECVQVVGEDVLGVLLQRGDLLQMSTDVVFLPQTYADMRAHISDYITHNGSVTLAQVRDTFKTSRKYAQALIEYLDSQGITRRVGDKRVLRHAMPPEGSR